MKPCEEIFQYSDCREFLKDFFLSQNNFLARFTCCRAAAITCVSGMFLQHIVAGSGGGVKKAEAELQGNNPKKF